MPDIPSSLLLLSAALLCSGCNKSLDNLGGPEAGQVQGMVCSDIATLQTAEEFPVTRAQLLQQGKCVELRSSALAKVIRTVEMPGKGRYSQFTLDGAAPGGKFWIRTDRIRV